jgi:hypothetical protein
MKQQPVLFWLVPLIAILAAVTASVGLFLQGGNGPFEFTTLHGQTAQIYGRGLYQYDTVFSATTFKGVDVITLLLSIPLLVIAFILYYRGSLRGRLLLISALPYFVYIGASMTFSAAYNNLFLLYAALFSASLFALVVALTGVDAETLSKHVLPDLPHRGIAIFMFIAGMGTLFLWLSDLIGPMMAGKAPDLLGSYTTMFTHGFDSAIITPATVLTGIYLLRRKPMGYVFAAPLLVFCTQNGFTVLAATISQSLAGIVFPMGVYIGMIGSWVLMGAFAIRLTIVFFRNISNSAA